MAKSTGLITNCLSVRAWRGGRSGLKPVEQEQLEVWFARLLLGWIDPKTASFRRADILPQNDFNSAA
jgi:hypothetical protein